jgi:hypothetical protein
MFILFLHTVTIKLQMFNTDCVKICLTALMDYAENAESHCDSQIMNMIKFVRFTCSHSIRSPTVTLCPNGSLVFLLFGAAHFGPPCLPPLWCCKVTCRHNYRTTTMAPRWRTASFPYRVHGHHSAVFPGKRTGSVGPIAWLLWDLVFDASWWM